MGRGAYYICFALEQISAKNLIWPAKLPRFRGGLKLAALFNIAFLAQTVAVAAPPYSTSGMLISHVEQDGRGGSILRSPDPAEQRLANGCAMQMNKARKGPRVEAFLECLAKRSGGKLAQVGYTREPIAAALRSEWFAAHLIATRFPGVPSSSSRSNNDREGGPMRPQDIATIQACKDRVNSGQQFASAPVSAPAMAGFDLPMFRPLIPEADQINACLTKQDRSDLLVAPTIATLMKPVLR